MPEKVILILVLILVILAGTAQIIFEGFSPVRTSAAIAAILLIAYLWFRPGRGR